jgi:hypothetical protein
MSGDIYIYIYIILSARLYYQYIHLYMSGNMCVVFVCVRERCVRKFMKYVTMYHM